MALDFFGKMRHARRLTLDHLREVRQRFSLDAVHVVEISGGALQRCACQLYLRNGDVIVLGRVVLRYLEREPETTP
jgi:hypothetical protein